jgi:hypothetical protein
MNRYVAGALIQIKLVRNVGTSRLRVGPLPSATPIAPKELGSGNAAAPSFHRIANVSGMTETALYVALQTSHRTMPNVRLEPDEMRDVVAYILSLKSE